MNQDQAQLLWRCARWFRPTGADTDKTKGDEEGDAVSRGQRQGQGDDGGAKGEEEEGDAAAPVVLVHGVFGERERGAGARELFSLFFLWTGYGTTVGGQYTNPDFYLVFRGPEPNHGNDLVFGTIPWSTCDERRGGRAG